MKENLINKISEILDDKLHPTDIMDMYEVDKFLELLSVDALNNIISDLEPLTYNPNWTDGKSIQC